MTTAAPVTSTLERELRNYVRQQGLVVWLDPDGAYSQFVDRLPGLGFPYPVVAFRGSFLELMLALEPHGNDLEPVNNKVLVHMPGFNTSSIVETPMLELYRAGKCFQKNLATLVAESAHGIALPEEVAAFIKRPQLSLASADDWLANLRRGETTQNDALEIYLQGRGTDGILEDFLNNDGRVAALLGTPPSQEASSRILEHLRRALGVTPSWESLRFPSKRAYEPNDLLDLSLSWLMAVEFVNDLKEPPVLEELKPLAVLPAPLVKECRQLVTTIRSRHAEKYRTLAIDVESTLDAERKSHHARALGNIDTFAFEELAIRGAALTALLQNDWEKVNSYALDRTAETCFWVRHDPIRQRVWTLIRSAALAGLAISENQNPFVSARSLDEALKCYADKAFVVDQRHRSFEQTAFAQLRTDLLDYDSLLDVQAHIRRAYRDWADALAIRFADLCQQYGPLPSAELRQREVYLRHVHPIVQENTPVAYFMVDAMRFEMAHELAGAFKESKFKVSLFSALAELPSVTEVGMNALAPVSREGRLRPVISDTSFSGMRAGEFTVRAPKDRIAAMKARSLQTEPIDIELDDLVHLSVEKVKDKLRRKSNLVVVRSRELDKAGETSVHLGTFTTILAQLRDAVNLLSQAGIECFVLASDHGFLLQDSATTQSESLGARMGGKKARYMLSENPVGATADTLEIPLTALQYDVSQEHYLVLRKDTAMWKTSEKVAPFVHGGNSAQERVIPVLVLRGRGPRGKTATEYEVVATALPALQGRQRLKIELRLQRRNTATMDFHGPKKISLALRVPGRADVGIQMVSASPPATIERGMLFVPPGADAAIVEFELDGPTDDRVKVEVFHAEGLEIVAPKIVDDFFDVVRDRRRSAVPPPPLPEQTPSAPAQDWRSSIEDADYRKVFEVLEVNRSVNEVELHDILGSPRRVRIFARHYDELVRLVPFRVEIVTQSGLKTYVKKDDRKL
ncbi:MAG: BREX-6 system phosphatase PglZ [Deltaproteobacteria bacterium]|nr:BREX-6 system phosphatase PglZ [Deltaproteobacteria bacterium]